MDDESAVLAYVRTRDPRVFRVLVERYHERVFRLVASLLGPHADLDAEEVTQEVFIRVCSRLDSFRGESKFGTWLYRLAYRLALEHRRRARITLPHLPAEVLERMAAERGDERLGEDRQKYVAGLLEELPDLYRTIVNMRYWLDCPVEEIALVLELPVGSVKSYLFRARERLKVLAQEQGMDFLE